MVPWAITEARYGSVGPLGGGLAPPPYLPGVSREGRRPPRETPRGGGFGRGAEPPERRRGDMPFPYNAPSTTLQ